MATPYDHQRTTPPHADRRDGGGVTTQSGAADPTPTACFSGGHFPAAAHPHRFADALFG
jgi:hypothetical protein